MKTIGIKLADGSFYPILTEGNPEKKQLNLTTVKDGQTKVQVDLYRSESGSMDDAEYVDSLEIKKLKKHPNGEPDINLDISIDENNELHAELHDPETGKDSSTTVSLVSKTIEQLNESSDITLAQLNDSESDEMSFSSDEDIILNPNSLNIDSLVEESSEDLNSFSESIETSQNDHIVSNSAGLDFSDILDEETIEGNAAGVPNTEEIRKKTKVPVLICIICAIICIIAVLLLLFIIPSKFNIINKINSSKTPPVEKVVETPKEEQAEIKHQAKEDEIVVAPIEEAIPEAKQLAKETKDVEYKIKWGDTLWDISQSYYNNPWKYPKIAKYNKIKNPDHIISGTKILIPAE